MANQDQKLLLAEILQKKAVEFREEAFELRAGGTSHWYVEVRGALSRGRDLHLAGEVIYHAMKELDWKFDMVGGMGVGGRALVDAVVFVAGDYGEIIPWVHGHEDAELNGINEDYLRGSRVIGKQVLAFDDTGTTGDSLLRFNEIITSARGSITGMVNLVDRSEGRVAARLEESGIPYAHVFDFHEADGLIMPAS